MKYTFISKYDQVGLCVLNEDGATKFTATVDGQDYFVDFTLPLKITDASDVSDPDTRVWHIIAKLLWSTTYQGKEFHFTDSEIILEKQRDGFTVSIDNDAVIGENKAVRYREVIPVQNPEKRVLYKVDDLIHKVQDNYHIWFKTHVIELSRRVEKLETKVNLLHSLLDEKKPFIWKDNMLVKAEDTRYERWWKFILSNGKVYTGIEEDISGELKRDGREDAITDLKIMIWALNPEHKETCFIQLSDRHKLRLDSNHMIGLILDRDPAMTVPIGYWLGLLDFVVKCCKDNHRHGFTNELVERIGDILGSMCNAKKEVDKWLK